MNHIAKRKQIMIQRQKPQLEGTTEQPILTSKTIIVSKRVSQGDVTSQQTSNKDNVNDS